MRVPLGPEFFDRPAPLVAPDLLGKFLVRKIGRKEIASMIVETEAYEGEEDLACHAAKGRTKRTEVMYGKPGHFYVYLIYGMYSMLNIVTHTEGCPSGVLIRGIEGCMGPGRLTRALDITRALYGKPAIPASGLWIEDRGVRIEKEDVVVSPRVGVAYAGEYWAGMPWRFTYDPKTNVQM